jgi:hypothetical protein
MDLPFFIEPKIQQSARKPASLPHSTTFQDFPGIYDQLSEVSKFQHHTKLYPTCSFSLISSSYVSPICWWKELLVECCNCHGNLGCNLTCTSCTIRYQTTQTAEIFHILQLFLILHFLYWRWSLDIYLLHIIPINCTFATSKMYVLLILHFPACFGLNKHSSGRLNHKGKQNLH